MIVRFVTINAIAEGFLPWYWCVFWFALSLPVVIYGFWQIRKIFREHPEQKLTMAISGAFIFVLSSLKMPSVTGSSSTSNRTGRWNNPIRGFHHG